MSASKTKLFADLVKKRLSKEEIEEIEKEVQEEVVHIKNCASCNNHTCLPIKDDSDFILLCARCEDERKRIQYVGNWQTITKDIRIEDE